MNKSLPGLQALIEQWNGLSATSPSGYYAIGREDQARQCATELSALLVVQGGVQQEEKDRDRLNFWCQDGHEPIRCADDGSEMCPVCKREAVIAELKDVIASCLEWPKLRDDGAPNRWHEYEHDPETTCCVVCGWAEQVHTDYDLDVQHGG